MNESRFRRVLFVSVHPDDEPWGCCGSVSKRKSPYKFYDVKEKVCSKAK